MKKVLVTGANKGIGYEIARHLGKKDWQVIIGARNEQRAQKAMQTLKADGVNVLDWQYVNLSDLKSIEVSIKEIKEKYPDLALLVNNAGIPGDMAIPSYKSELKDVMETIQVNYFGTFALTKGLIPLLANNHGRICNITVPSTFSPYWHPMAYVASKAAQNTMTTIMAADFEHDKVPVEIFDIHPGATSTDLNNHYSGPGSHQPDVIGEKVEEIIDDGKKHNGEFIELYPIVDEGNY
ncbi:MAG: SDR family NAD(P)-dependent oxidoreductase [Prevotellaceae bacterium]|nr:SDR family NAD(P)-dependent oxidoreductase [Prevotella sp.]MDD6552176.1 SDR family NAD(P)-dependent oxidoreductase [Prevotellaceae bacterium]